MRKSCPEHKTDDPEEKQFIDLINKHNSGVTLDDEDNDILFDWIDENGYVCCTCCDLIDTDEDGAWIDQGEWLCGWCHGDLGKIFYREQYIQKVVDYLIEDEAKHYEECGRPKGHIYETLLYLKGISKECVECERISADAQSTPDCEKCKHKGGKDA